MVKLERQPQCIHQDYQQMPVLNRDDAQKYQLLLGTEDPLFHEINRMLTIHQSGMHQLSNEQKINTTRFQLLGGSTEEQMRVDDLRGEIDRISKEIDRLKEDKKEALQSWKENKDDQELSQIFRQEFNEIGKKIQRQEIRKEDFEKTLDEILKKMTNKKGTNVTAEVSHSIAGGKISSVSNCAIIASSQCKMG